VRADAVHLQQVILNLALTQWIRAEPVPGSRKMTPKLHWSATEVEVLADTGTASQTTSQ
jgi:hypothetical protein